MTLVPLLALAVTAGACATTTSDSSLDANESEIREGGVCSTLDYGHTRANADHFLTFADDDAIKAYAEPFLATVDHPPFKEVSHDARLERLIAEVYAGFKKVFPRETAGFDTPPSIVIVQSNVVNAFAVGIDSRPEVQKAPWLVFVHSSILERPLGDSELRGLFAHELGHLVLRNPLQETRAKIRVHYRGKTIGNVADDDPAVRARAEELRTLGAKVGRFADLGPVAFGVFSTTEYQSAFSWFRTQRTRSPAPAACAAADDAAQRLVNRVNTYASLETFSVALDDGRRAEVRALAGEARTAFAECYGHVKGSLLEVKVRAALARLPPEQAEPLVAKVLDPSTPEHAEVVEQLLPTEIERAVDAEKEERPAIERVFDVIEKLHARIADLESDPSLPIDDIRVFDFEEDSDDASVRVLRAIGDDPLANAKFLLTVLEDPEGCVRLVEAGKEPAYGGFVDPHNGTCWRYWHIVQLSKALDTCDPSAGGARPAKGSGIPSAADKAPSELLEKGPSRAPTAVLP
jgi:hypothetical protein